jgi:Asparagine synthase
MGDGDEPITDVSEAARLVRAALEDSIRVRLDTDLTVGVILSGGLDSTLTLLHVREMHPECVAFTIGTPGSDDVSYARRVTRELGVGHEVIELAPGNIGLSDIREAIRLSELTEYGDVINAVISACSSPASTAAVSRWSFAGTALMSFSAATRCTGSPTPLCDSACSSTSCTTSGGPSCNVSIAPAWGRAWKRACRSSIWSWSGWRCSCLSS